MNIKEILKGKKARYASGILMLIATAVFYFNGCGGDLQNINLPIDESVKVQLDSLNAALKSEKEKSTELELLLDSAVESNGKLTSDLTYQTERKEYYKSKYLSSKPTDILFKDTCFASLSQSEQVKAQLAAKDRIIEIKDEQLAAMRNQIDEAVSAYTKSVEEKNNTLTVYSNLKASSPYYNERASIQRNEKGEPFILFQKTQNLQNQLEDIVNETFDINQPTFYRFAWSGGWMLTNDFGDFSTHQGYTTMLLYRVHPRFGFGLQASYTDRNLRLYAPNSSKLGFGILLEYNFNFKRK